MELYGHLWTSAPAPWQYIELILCRDIYHCTPVELGKVPYDTITAHLEMMEIEAEVRAAKREAYNG